MSASPSRPRTFDQERSFGKGVGGVLLLIGGWWTYRSWHAAGALGPAVLVTGALLLVLGLVAPRTLTGPARWWMILAHALGWLSTRVVLSVFFILVVTPVGIVRRLMGADPLRRRGPAGATFWVPYSERQRDPKYYERMF